MKLAILFWFYKEPDVCKDRLKLLRQDNPTTPIYGLYGGDLATVGQYKSQLNQYLDDFYTFPENKDSHWKWLQGDLLLTDWYRERGQYLSWDTVVIVQWDMLVFGAIEQLFSMLQPGQILLSGLRPIKEIENDWMWVTPKNQNHRQTYLEFLEHITKTYDYDQEPMGCLFIAVCLPRTFLERYAYIEQPDLGFIEYRIPMYAQIFGIPFCEDHPFQADWGRNDPRDPMFRAKNPVKRLLNAFHLKLNPIPLNPWRDISLIPIYRQLRKKAGFRIFHPYQRLFPTQKRQWLIALLDEFKRGLDRLVQKTNIQSKG
jgi:hypothetical protein